MDPVVDQAPPDWAQTEDLPCPRCAYNLRALTRPKCPECGLDFDWQIVRDRRDAARNPLFEHQFDKRPFSSLAKTMKLLFVPWRFWRALPLEAPPRVGGVLAALCASIAVVCALRVAIGMGLEAAINVWLRNTPWRWAFGNWVNWAAANAGLQAAVGFIIPAALLLFWQTRKRYRIRRDVLVRFAVYPAITWVLWSNVAGVSDQVYFTLRFIYQFRQPFWVMPRALSLGLLIVPLFVAIAEGLRLHLRIPRPWTTAALAFAVLLVVVYGFVIVSIVALDSADPRVNPVIAYMTRVLPGLDP